MCSVANKSRTRCILCLFISVRDGGREDEIVTYSGIQTVLIAVADMPTELLLNLLNRKSCKFYLFRVNFISL